MSDLGRTLLAHDSSVRLRAAMDAGARADADDAPALVARCAVEQDFFVRDMLTWALTRLPTDVVVPLLRTELADGGSQARSQALHTLSKIGDESAFPDVLPFVDSTDDEIAKAAWRAAVTLAPADEARAVAVRLSHRLGHGDRQMQLSLSRALVALGEDVVGPVLDRVPAGPHVDMTRRLLRDPDAGSEFAVEDARREVALGRTRSAKG